MKFRKEKREQIEVMAPTATATRALFAGNEQFPNIQFIFKGADGKDYSFIMPLAEASKFTQQAINSIQAATPTIPRPAANQLFG